MREKGFTLAELLITLAVGSILLSVAVPSYTVFVRNAGQVASANELISSLHHARDLAITRNMRVTVCPSSAGADCEATSWDEGWIVFADPDDSRSVNGTESVGRVVSDVEALSISSDEFGSFLVYRPNGRAMAGSVTDNTGELTLCDERGSEHARVVIVDVSGRPRVSRTAADGSAPQCPGS